jgi:hypothetical protein
MTRFRPCIDLHAGSVKQIVGGTLTTDSSALKTNFTSEHPAAYFAELYRENDLRGGHVIMLGPGNDEAARESLAAWPGGLQVGGGIKDGNAREWIERGAEKVYTYLSICFPQYPTTYLSGSSRRERRRHKTKNYIPISPFQYIFPHLFSFPSSLSLSPPL